MSDVGAEFPQPNPEGEQPKPTIEAEPKDWKRLDWEPKDWKTETGKSYRALWGKEPPVTQKVRAIDAKLFLARYSPSEAQVLEEKAYWEGEREEALKMLTPQEKRRYEKRTEKSNRPFGRGTTHSN